MKIRVLQDGTPPRCDGRVEHPLTTSHREIESLRIQLWNLDATITPVSLIQMIMLITYLRDHKF
jgi:hypothetical protein